MLNILDKTIHLFQKVFQKFFMNILKKISYSIYLLIAIFYPLEIFASCENSPQKGLLIETKNESTKLISTYQIDIQSEDEIFRALIMAENQAKL